MKRILSFILLVTIVLGTCSLAACNLFPTSSDSTTKLSEEPKYSEGLKFKSINNGRAYSVSGIGECTDLDIVIPSEYNGKPVTAIANSAFFSNKEITSVKIPEGVTSIGSDAFGSCFKLENVELPSTLTEISSYAFSCCISLKNINLHSGITNIDSGAFYLCTSLEKLTVPAEIENLYVYYLYLNSLKSFEIDGESDFVYTVDGNLYAEFYDGKTYLLAYASGKEDTEFTVPSDVDAIASGAFSFYPWDYEKTENVDSNTILIFDYYSNLKKVIVSEGVESIGTSAFIYCNGLHSVFLPNTLSYIAQDAFIACTSLDYIEFNGTVAEWEAIEKEDGWFTNCPITTIKCTDGYSLPNADSTKETINIWVSTTMGVKEYYEERIAKFMKDHHEYNKYKIVVSTVSERDAASEVIKDVLTAPDIYCFPSSELERLVQANALSLPSINSQNVLKNRNDSASTAAGTFNGELYAYPVSGSNGYYMYYDKSIITNPDSLEQIIADVENYNLTNSSNKSIGFNLSNGWYGASFFFGAGCYSNWSYDGSQVSSFDDNFNSENGLIALKGMQKLLQSSCFTDSINFNHSAVVVTGMWDHYAAEAAFGENLGIADLPSYTVDGVEYHLGSFTNHVFMGVKPQKDRNKSAFLHDLASYLTNKECQLEAYNKFEWIPTNRVAQMEDVVASNERASALIQQNQYATTQKSIPNDWWMVMSIIVDNVMNATTDDELRNALALYEEEISKINR